MERIIATGDKKLPTLNFDAETGIVLIAGRCIPENSVEFFEPLMNWISSYSESPNANTVLDIYLDYFNTSSSKCILDLLKTLEKVDKMGKTSLSVKWRYMEEDEDMMEAGEDYASMVDVPFEIIEMD